MFGIFADPPSRANAISQPQESGADPLKKKSFKDGGDEDPYLDKGKDDKDSEWIDKNLAGGAGRETSDAVLNCPCCFHVLCIDCQRHDRYPDQYRAMFVQNCKVNCAFHVTFHPVEEETPKKKQKKRKKVKWIREEVPMTDPLQTNTNTPETELFYPVQCTYCDTEVAVYDQYEIYHFYNTICGY